jgi:putative ABC transport system permease protein
MGGSGGASGPRLSDLAPDYVDLQVSDLNDITVQLSDLTDTMDLVGTGLFLVLLVIALMGLSSTFRMVMIERTAEIGALRALGMQRGRVIAMFLAEAMSVTLLGAAAGVLLGFLAMPVLSLFHLSETGPMVLFLRAGRLVFNPDPTKLLLNVLLLLAAGALAVLPQAYTASRMNPAAALSKTT